MRLDRDVVERVAAPRAGVVTTAMLLDLGADRAWLSRQVARGHWQRLHHGVLLTHDGPVPWRSRAWAALLHGGPGAALSHAAAAHLHGFRAEPPRVLDVSIPEHRRVAATPGVVLHRRLPMPPSGGRPARTWVADTALDLVAAAGTEDDVIGHLCAAVRAGTRPVELEDAIGRRPRFRHRALVLDLLPEVQGGIESPLEHRYHRDVERRHGLPAARLQVRERLPDGWIRADCLYEEWSVRVELDGALAHPAGRTDADTWRDNAVLISTGDLTLRYRWRHVAAPCRTAVQVAAALQRRGWPGSLRRCPRCPAT